MSGDREIMPDEAALFVQAGIDPNAAGIISEKSDFALAADIHANLGRPNDCVGGLAALMSAKIMARRSTVHYREFPDRGDMVRAERVAFLVRAAAAQGFVLARPEGA